LARHALFAGLIVDEYDQAVEATSISGEAFYVVDDDGFRRHIESEFVDRQILDSFSELIQGYEELISEETMKMIGQEDIFTKAMIETSLRNLDQQFDEMIERGLPEEVRAWLGMMGFRVVINLHGEVVKVEHPSRSEDPE
jgi:hypothetical protein